MEAHITWGILWILSAVSLSGIWTYVGVFLGGLVGGALDEIWPVAVGYLVGVGGAIAWFVFSVVKSVDSWVALAGG